MDQSEEYVTAFFTALIDAINKHRQGDALNQALFSVLRHLEDAAIDVEILGLQCTLVDGYFEMLKQGIKNRYKGEAAQANAYLMVMHHLEESALALHEEDLHQHAVESWAQRRGVKA